MTSDPINQTQSVDTLHFGDAIELIRQSLEKIRFGAIQLTVHEGRLVQLDITEKQRFPER